MCNKHFICAIVLLFITAIQLISLTTANYGNTAQLINPQLVGQHAQIGLQYQFISLYGTDRMGAEGWAGRLV